jgi:hypothetical protein
VIVVDTNVIIAGARSKKGASYRILSAMVEKRLDFLISVPLFLEYEEVLKRPSVVSNLSIAEIDQILNGLAAYGKSPEYFTFGGPLFQTSMMTWFLSWQSPGRQQPLSQTIPRTSDLLCNLALKSKRHTHLLKIQTYHEHNYC